MTSSPSQRPAPGEHLKNLLREKGLKNAELAARMGRSAQYVTDIIKGKKAMDVDLAIDLAAAFPEGPKAPEWMNVAIDHRLASLQPTRPQVLARHDYAKELIKLKWIDGSKNPAELETELQTFWELRDVAANFKTSLVSAVDDTAKRAWAIQVYREAMFNVAESLPAYDERKLPQLYRELKKLMADPGDIRKIKPLVQSYGIQVVYLPNPKQCAVDGIASHNGGKPYIGLSLRIARFDSFCFTLWHELNHVEHRDSARPDVIDAPTDDKIEMRANREAGEHLLPEAAYRDFVFRGNYTFNAIQAAADAHNIHVSILLGRLKRDHLLDWSQFAREHPGVRDTLLAAQA